MTARRSQRPAVDLQTHRDKPVLRVRFWTSSETLFDVRVRIDEGEYRTRASRLDLRDEVKRLVEDMGSDRYAAAWAKMGGDPLGRAYFAAERSRRRDEAQLRQTEEEAAALAGMPTIGRLADHYRVKYVTPPTVGADGLKESGLKTWQRVDFHVSVIERLFGRNLKLADLTFEHVREFKIARLREPLARGGGKRSAADVHRTLAVLRRMIRIAVRQRWMKSDDDPFLEATSREEALIRPSKEKPREETLSPADEKLVLAELRKLDPLVHALIVALIDTGARVGEFVEVVTTEPRRRGSDPSKATRKGKNARPQESAEEYAKRVEGRRSLAKLYPRAKWPDVDLEAGTINLHASKTESERTVGITDRLRVELERLHTATLDPAGEVFAGLTYWRVRSRWVDACKRAKVEALGLHQLRHTRATRWIQGGLPESLVAHLLGHSPKSNVTRRYVNADANTIKLALLADQRYQREHGRKGRKREEEAIN